jgi:hypothetical protein
VPIYNDLRPALVELIGNRKRGPLFVFVQNGCECPRCVELTKQRVVGEPLGLLVYLCGTGSPLLAEVRHAVPLGR